MLKRLLLIVAIWMACATAGEARARYSNWCMVGNQNVTITGAGTSTTDWMLSGPSCTVTVYLTGTLTLASIYSNNSGAVLANPFTATSTGYFSWYADNSRYDVVLSGGGLPSSVTLGDVILIDTASLSPASLLWSGLGDPTGNLALSMSTNTSTFTWGNMATTANSFSLTDGASSTSTGSLFRAFTGSGSTMKPFTATAQGTANGVQMSSAGALAAIGTGAIAATTISCTTCITDGMVDSITTRSKLPSAIAYEDEANVFTTGNTFNTTVAIKGGQAFTLTLTGTPTGNRVVTIPDATSTLVNLTSTQTLSGKTFSDDLVWTSGTAFTGTLGHANAANRAWNMPDAAGTVLLAPTLTTGAVMFNNGTSLDEDPTELFWNTTTKRLGVGNAAPAASVHVQPRATASEVALRVQGDATANADVLQVYNSAGSPAKISHFASNGGLNTAVAVVSTLATGTAPLTIASTTKVNNLNVDSLEGGDWAIPGTIGSTTPNTGAFSTLTASSTAVVTTSVSSAQLISTVATGTAPLAITSTTPVTNLHTRATAYNAAGTQQVNGHVVFGTCTLGTSCSITLTGSAAFTSTSSYYCVATDMTSAAATKVVNTSASQVDITGTGTDVLAYLCFGT